MNISVSNTLKQINTTTTDTTDVSTVLKENIEKSYAKAVQDEYNRLNSISSGDSFNKQVTNTTDNLNTSITTNTSVSLKTKIDSLVDDAIKSDSTKDSVNSAINKYIDSCVEDICKDISSTGKTAEEYRIYVESAIRSVRNTLIDNPELETTIKKSIEDIVKKEVSTNVTNEMNPIIQSIQQSVNSTASGTQSTIDKQFASITTANVEKMLKSSVNTNITSFADTISNNTFGQLSNLPLVGSYFSSLQKALDSTVKTTSKSLFDQEYTKISSYVKEVVTVQNEISKYQKDVDLYISKVKQEAISYTAQLEQRLINEVSKYIKLDNVSIGGLKL